MPRPDLPVALRYLKPGAVRAIQVAAPDGDTVAVLESRFMLTALYCPNCGAQSLVRDVTGRECNTSSHICLACRHESDITYGPSALDAGRGTAYSVPLANALQGAFSRRRGATSGTLSPEVLAAL